MGRSRIPKPLISVAENLGTFETLMQQVCYDVETEPKLQPLEGESFVEKTTT